MLKATTISPPQALGASVDKKTEFARAVPLFSSVLIGVFLGGSSVVAYLPFALSVFFMGLPHGASDLYLILNQKRKAAWWAVGYFAVVFASALFLWLFPLPSLLAFLLLSLLHFGFSDHDRSFGRAPDRLHKLFSYSRAGLILAFPFALVPERAWEPFAVLLSVLGHAPSVAATSFEGVWVALSSIALTTNIMSLAALSAEEGTNWVSMMLSSVAVVMLCVFTPPVYAIGCYFLILHAWPQIEREKAGTLLECVQRNYKKSLSLFLPSLAVMFFLYGYFELSSIVEFASLSLALYAVVTPAHHVLHSLVLKRR